MSATAVERQELEFAIKGPDGDVVTCVSSPSVSEYIFGRAKASGIDGARVLVQDRYMSKKHCRLTFRPDGGWFVEDLESANGSSVNGNKLTAAIALPERCSLRLGRAIVTIRRVSMEAGDDDPTMAARTIAPGQLPDPEEKTVKLNAAGVTEFGADDSPTVAVGAGVNDGPTMFAAADDEAETRVGGLSDTDATMATARSASGATTAAARTRPPDRETRTEAASTRPPVAATPPAPAPAPAASASIELPKTGIVPTLLKLGFATEAQALAGALADARATGKTFFRAFIEGEAAKHRMESIYRGIARTENLELLDDPDELYDRAYTPAWLSWEQAERLGIIALSQDGDEPFFFGSLDPYDLLASDWVQARCGASTVSALVVLPHAFEAAVGRLRQRDSATGDTHNVAIEFTPEREEEFREHLGDADAPQIVDYFLHRASLQGASDIHIEPTENLLVIRVRVDGVLHQDVSLPSAYHSVVSSRLKIMSGMDVAEKRRPQDGRIGVVIRGNPIDVRVSTFPTVYGEKIVMRLLDKNALRPSPEALGLLPRDLRVLKDKIHAPYGLVMLCGPTGSGKTTTLYSCLGAIDKLQKNVLTVEDPVEYRLAGVHQMQVNHRINLDFASGMRTILRQDPDVIMVGECRDLETAAMAIQASLTGHVVFSTIHTNDAVGVITRLIDLGIEPYLAASSLSLAIAQRLVRELCPNCRQPVSGDEILARLKREGVSDEKLAALDIEIDPFLDYADAVGCKHCRDSGYAGRLAVFEVFEMSIAAREMVAAPNFQEEMLREHAKQSGMTTLVSHGLSMVEQDKTTFSEIVRVLGEVG